MRRVIVVLPFCLFAFVGCVKQHVQPGRAQSVPAQEASVKPGINQPYFDDPSIPKWQGVLETESREVYRERQRIVDAIGLMPGQRVADVGSGTGLFTVLLAKAVGPQGEVVAEDIVPEFLQHVRERADAEHLGNVTTSLGTATDIRLQPGHFDVIFLCDVYHHFEYPAATLKSIRRALKRDGRLVVVDFNRIPGTSEPWVLEHVRADRATVTQEIEGARFKVVAKPPDTAFLQQNYWLAFRKSR